MMNNQLGTEIAHHPVAVFPFPVSSSQLLLVFA